MTIKQRLILKITIAFLLLSNAASSAPLCFQNVGGVPGAYGEPPQWWAGGSPIGSATTRWIDDPRWQGASAVGEAADAVRFRGLREAVGSDRFLDLMWHVRANPAATTPDERLYFGFADDTLASRWVIEIHPLATAATPVAGSSAFEANVYLYDSAASEWQLQAVPPSWLSTWGKLDVYCPSAACDEWSFRVRVPLTNTALVAPPVATATTKVSIAPGGPYRFFYQVTSLTDTPVTHYEFPAGLDDISLGATNCALGAICPSNPNTQWAEFSDVTSCAGDISLTPQQIYIGSAGNSQVSLSAVNALQAHPTNNKTTAINGNDIRARFRLANWGSTIGVSPAWEQVACAGIDSDGHVTGTASAVPSLGQLELLCNWSVPVADRCKYKPAGDACGAEAGSRHYDQCVLVDLAPVTGTANSYFFAPQSAWRNLQFTGASKITKAASLDIRGLAAGDPARDVYVYVQTRNMPQRVTQGAPGWAEGLGKEMLTKLRRLDVPLDEGATVGKAAAARIQSALTQGLLSDSEVMSFMPSYMAYVWHDSGKTWRGRPVLTPQASFGYVIWHDGALHGWEHLLTATTGTLSEIAPNYFKIAVPVGGIATVQTTIEALEQPPIDGTGGASGSGGATGGGDPPVPPPTWPSWCWWLLGLLVVLVLVFVFVWLPKHNH